MENMKHVGNSVTKGLALALGAQRDYFEAVFNDSFWVLRTIKYPPVETRDQLGCGAHTDYGCFTFVLSDETPGCFQIWKGKEGWVDIPHVPGAFIVNVGDMLAAWTGGQYQSTLHRVLSPTGTKSRISVPFFFEPNYNHLVQPLDVFHGSQNAHQNEWPDGYTYGMHLEHRVLSNFTSSSRLVDNKIR